MGDISKSKKLSIVTLNTLGTPFFAPDITKRYKKIANLISNENYDIVCLQEIFTYYHLFIFKNILKKFPFVAFQKNLFGPRGGLVIFSKQKLINTHFFTFSYPKGASVPFYVWLARQGIFSAEIEGTSLKIITTHLSSDETSYLTPQNKLYSLIKNELQETATLVNSGREKSHSLIITGDFNIAKNNGLYKQFMRDTKVIDVFEKKESPTYNPDRLPYFYNAPKSRIDYIFIKTTNKKIKVLNMDTVFSEQEKLSNGKKSFLSDHIGLHCILEVND
jgi:endonuclease/exonuclease/phosphatase family metal-dependent hydrolase